MDTPLKAHNPPIPNPVVPGAEPTLGVDESILRERYREFCRKEARRALESVELFERGQKMKVIRAYLLNEHAERENYKHMIAEGEYDEFHKVSEDHLLKVTMEGLRLPNFEDWKRYALSAISDK